MAAKKNTAGGYDLLIAELKKNKNATYADLKAKADKKGLAIYPVMYGRAKAALGLVKVAKYGTGKTAKASKHSTAKKATTKKARGRPAKAKATRGASGDPLAVIQGVFDAAQEQERESAQMRDTLKQIRDLIDRVL